MSNKKYYWLKLNDNFFDEDTIVWLEEQENGKDYVNFYLKLLLKSLREEGKLVRYIGERVIPYDTKSLSKLTNTPVDTVAVAMKVFIDIGLVQELDSGELYLTQLNEMIGSETRQASIMRRKRALEKAVEYEEVTLLPDVTKCYTEIEIELERELEKDNTIVEQPIERYDYTSVIDYLNEVTGSNYRNGSSHQTHIRARYKEGYTLEDFKQVIDIKSAEWKNDKEYSKYLTPSTLFGNKFDTYLNQVSKHKEELNRATPILEFT